MRTWAITYTIEDDKRQKSVMVVHASIASNTIVDVTHDPLLFAQALALRIDPVITGRIARIGLRETVDLPPGLKAVARPEADVEEGLTFLFRTAARPANLARVRLPTVDESLFWHGRVPAPGMTAAFDALLDLLITGDGWQIYASDARGEDLANIWQIDESFKPSRPG